MKRALIAFGVLAIAALAALGVSAQSQEGQGGQTQQQGNWAVAALEEVGGSGYQGIAALRGSDSETEVLVVVMPPEGLFSFLQPGEDEIGPVAVHEGTCDEPGSQVASLGQPNRIEQGEDSVIYAAAGSIPLDLESVLSGEHIVVVSQMGQNGTITPTPNGTPTPDGDGAELLACGELSSEGMLDGAPAPGDGGPTPDGTPTITPSPTPNGTPTITPSPTPDAS